MILSSNRGTPSRYWRRLRRFVYDRRSGAAADVLEEGPVVLDVRQRVCLVDGNQIELTFIEFEMLKTLMAQPNRFLGATELLRTVWDGRHPVPHGDAARLGQTVAR